MVCITSVVKALRKLIKSRIVLVYVYVLCACLCFMCLFIFYVFVYVLCACLCIELNLSSRFVGIVKLMFRNAHGILVPNQNF